MLSNLRKKPKIKNYMQNLSESFKICFIELVACNEYVSENRYSITTLF